MRLVHHAKSDKTSKKCWLVKKNKSYCVRFGPSFGCAFLFSIQLFLDHPLCTTKLELDGSKPWWPCVFATKELMFILQGTGKNGIVGLTLNPSHPILIMCKHNSFRHLGLSTCLGQNFEDLSVEQHDHSAQPTCSQVFASKARETFRWNICCNSLACEGTPGIQHLL